MTTRSLHRALGAAALLVATRSHAQQPSAPVRDWLRANAISLRVPTPPVARPFGALEARFASARVLGLGEATHGQHESFELKRRLTMHAIREHGYRLVAYEASAASLLAGNDYIAGRTSDRRAAVRSLGMLIWIIEENGALFDDLRAWNASHPPEQQVRLIGVDAQDGEAAIARLGVLLAPDAAGLVPRATAMLERAQGATQRMFSGDRAGFDSVQIDAGRLAEALRAAPLAATASSTERELRVQEYVAHLGMYGTRGGRDKAMATLLLAQLATEPAGTRCVLWAHNSHLQKSPLRFLGSDELAMGGHLRAALGDGYYAIGVAFGEGEFQANVQGPNGRWLFKRYTIGAPPRGSLEAQLAQVRGGDFLLDLRSETVTPAVERWLGSTHGQRWWGGYNVPDDVATRAQSASQLMQTVPRADFDGLAFLRRTRAASPLDSALVVPASVARTRR